MSSGLAGLRLFPGLERELAELAEYHVGLFAGEASNRGDAAAVAHALFLLAQAAECRRQQWLGRQAEAPAAGDITAGIAL